MSRSNQSNKKNKQLEDDDSTCSKPTSSSADSTVAYQSTIPLSTTI